MYILVDKATDATIRWIQLVNVGLSNGWIRYWTAYTGAQLSVQQMKRQLDRGYTYSSRSKHCINHLDWPSHHEGRNIAAITLALLWKYHRWQTGLECGPMPNVMVVLPNIGGALCSTTQSLA